MVETNNYVLIIGSSNMDLNVYLERLPKPGETVTGGVHKQFLGGKGANQAVASVRSGAKTVFIGKIGKDMFGDQMLSRLKAEGIDTSHIFRDPNEASGVALIMIDSNGENIIGVAPGANFRLTPDEVKIKSNLIKNAGAIVVQMEISIATIDTIFRIASQGNAIKILNPAPLKPIPLDTLKKVDIIVPNEGELLRLHSFSIQKELSGSNNEKIKQASKNLTKLGIKTIITTLGKKGALIYYGDKDKFEIIPALKVQAVDTVGAGDCFNGCLASALSIGKTISEAAKFATAAASIAVTRKGAQKSMPYYEEIIKKIKN
ncbi:Ribokinase [subsurface metagenome]